jgi:hypothetical protein
MSTPSVTLDTHLDPADYPEYHVERATRLFGGRFPFELRFDEQDLYLRYLPDKLLGDLKEVYTGSMEGKWLRDLFRHCLQQACKNVVQGEYKTHGSVVGLSLRRDIDALISELGFAPQAIFAPFNDRHYATLAQVDVKNVVRDKLFLNRFNCKVRVTTSSLDTELNTALHRVSTIGIHKPVLSTIRQEKSICTTFVRQLQREYSDEVELAIRSNFDHACIFSDYDGIRDVLIMSKLEYPFLNFEFTRCTLVDDL